MVRQLVEKELEGKVIADSLSEAKNIPGFGCVEVTRLVYLSLVNQPEDVPEDVHSNPE